jgi:hypothetical protein
MKRQMTKEEKVANQIAKTLSPVDLDLDEVGFFLAKIKPTTHYNRLILVAESAVSEQEKIDNPDYNRYDSMEQLF